jgi:hypothetical protein
VQNLLDRYFAGINSHDYAEYASTLDAGMQGNNSSSSFNTGYATTKDSDEVIDSIASNGSGLVAVIAFTSHQASADSVDGSTCNNWQLTLPLVPQGSGYVITTPPSGYATYTNC